MCLIFIALKQNPVYKLIVAANRDEFYQRKTAAAHWWDSNSQIVGGKDLEAGGTWLGMNRNGRIGMVTNFRDPQNIKAQAPSRGHLVSEYLSSTMAPEKYVNDLKPTRHHYNGFNLLVGDAESFWYISNYNEGMQELKSGFFGLSNHLLETPWPKVIRGKQKLTDLVSASDVSSDEIFETLFDDQRAPDETLPDTGVGLERERALSAMFIKSPGYGTRCSTVIMVDYAGNVSFKERVYDVETFRYSLSSFNFTILPGVKA
jgi:uncharacterized protein with NRDE domain